MSKGVGFVFYDNYGDFRLGWVFASFIAVLGLGLLLLGVIVRQVDHYYSAKYCQPHLKQINRTGKFVDYNYWDYQCLAKTGDKYVPLDQIYNNLQVEVKQ